MKTAPYLLATAALIQLVPATAQGLFSVGGGSATSPAKPASTTPAVEAQAPVAPPSTPPVAIPAAASSAATQQTAETRPAPGAKVTAPTPAPVAAPAPVPAPASAPSAAAGAAGATTAQPRTTEAPRMLRGNDRVIAPPRIGNAVPGGAAGLKFEDAPLADVVHVVMREMARVNYMLYPPITGSVTLSVQGSLSTDDAVFVLESALLANGFVMAQDARGTYHIGKPDVVRNIVPGVRQVQGNGPIQAGQGTIIVPLKYIGAAEMAAILRPIVPASAIVRVDNLRNLLVMSGNRSQAEGWLDMVNTFDVDMLKGMSVGLYPLKHLSTREIDMALRALSSRDASALPTSGAATPQPAGATAAASTAATGTTASPASAGAAAGSNAAGLLFGALKVITLDALNAVLLVSPRAALLDDAKAWLDRIDRPGGSEPQLFVYPVQHGSATHLASVMGGLFGISNVQGAAGNVGSGVAPGLGQATAGTGFAGGFGTPIAGNTGTTGGFGGTGAAGGLSINARASNTAARGPNQTVVAAEINGMRVIADGVRNAIIVFGTPAQYAKVEAALKRLDVPPAQILIEASIIEVSLTDDLQYGLEWSFSEQRNGGTGVSTLSRAAGGALSNLPAGLTYSFTKSTNDVRAVINALASKSLIRVISSPSLMVMDNHTASITVGTQQPVQSGQTITTGGNISSNIQYKDTGVNLVVTPSSSSGDMVTMQLTQGITDVGAIDAATGQRSFSQRQIDSKVAVRSGETVVLGGLIRDNTTSGKAGIPLLQDLPLVGNLFGTNSKAGGRTELLVMITPRVVRSDTEVRDLAAQVRERMKGIQRDSLFPDAPIDWTPNLEYMKRQQESMKKDKP